MQFGAEEAMRQWSVNARSNFGQQRASLHPQSICHLFFLIALEIMKPLQLCVDFQVTSSRWLFSCKHRLGLSSKRVGKLTKYLRPLRKFLDLLTYLFFRQTGQSQSCPCEKSRQFLQTRMLHPLDVMLISFSIVILQQSKTQKNTKTDRHGQTQQTLKHKTPWISGWSVVIFFIKG